MIYSKGDITIRPLKKEDLSGDYLNWMHDPIATQFNSHGNFPLSDNDLVEFIKSLESKNKIVWAILFKGEYIGNISLQSINWINRTGEMAIFIGKKKCHGKGIGTEAVRLLFAHGFDKLNLNKIYLGTARTNTGMINIALKLGMKQEGILKNHVFLNGKYTDVMQFEIMRDRWKGK